MRSSQAPTSHAPPSERRHATSLLIVNTGDGKGKSSSAFGVVMRARARGWNVAVVQFLKSGRWHTGEEAVALDLGVDWWALGDGFTWDSPDLTRDEAVARAAWQHAASLLRDGTHELVVLDEITYPINWGWIDLDAALAAIQERWPGVNVLITGRDAPSALIDAADTVTEMRKIKHAYDSGVLATRGIDY